MAGGTGDTTHRLPGDFVIPLPGQEDVAPAPGRLLLIPGYEVRRELARGGMGVVLEAWSARHQRAVALKVVLESIDPELLTRFRREAEAMARLQHPNVVPVLDHGEALGCPFLVMELVPGETLEALVKSRGPLAEEEAARIVAKLADALAQAHERGVLHRDLKPANVIVEPDGTPRLVDFGLARLDEGADRERLTVTGMLLGTPAYMAPEQVMGGRGEVGPHTDVYGLGTVLYEALTGTPPFVGKSAFAILESVAKNRPVSPDQLRAGLDPTLAAICMRCLEKSPERRWPGPIRLHEALVEWRARRRVARRSGRVVLAAGILAGGAALAAGVVVVQSGTGGAAAVSTGARPLPSPSAPSLRELLHGGRDRDLIAAADLAGQQPADLAALTAEEQAALAFGRYLAVVVREGKANDLSLLQPLRAAPAPWPDFPRLIELAQARRHDELPELLARLDARFPELSWLAMFRAEMLSVTEGYRAALPAYDEALRREPDSPLAFLHRGQLYGREGEIEEALADFDAGCRAARGNPISAELLLRRGEAHLRLGDLAAAEHDFTAALEVDPRQQSAWTCRGMARASQGDPEEARTCLARALELGPAGFEEHLLEGRLFLQARDPRRALLAFDAAGQLSPGAADMLANRSAALLQLGRLDEALAAAEAAVRAAPALPAPHLALVQAHVALEDMPAALAAIERAAGVLGRRAAAALDNQVRPVARRLSGHLSPGTLSGVFLSITNAAREGRSDPELLALLDAPQLEAPDDPAIRWLRWCLLGRLGRGAEAQAQRPTTPMTGRETGHLAAVLGTLGFQREALEGLVEYLQKVDSRDPECLRALVFISTNQGDWKATGTAAQALLDAVPEGHLFELDGLWARAHAFANLGQPERARVDYQLLLQRLGEGVPYHRPADEVRRALEGLR